MDVFVRFWGTRGSIPAPGHATRKFGGNTSCVEIRVGQTVLVCDAGTGIRELGMDLLRRQSDPVEVHMFFSHMHWDHIQGFPFFVPAYDPKTTLYVYETAPGADRVQRLLHGQMKSDHFPVDFGDLGSFMVARQFDSERRSKFGLVKVTCFEQHHPGTSYAYAFEIEGKKIVYATDNEIDLTLVNGDRVEDHPDEPRVAPDAFVRFLADADLLIADGQYTDEEYPRKVGWGHARANTVVDVALQAGVKSCALFHHDPLHNDTKVQQIVKEGRKRIQARGAELQLFGAREGLELKI